MLDRPHLPRTGPQGQALRVAVTVRIDQRSQERVVRGRGARQGVHPQYLPAERVQVLRDGPDSLGVAGGDPQIAIGAEAQAAAVVVVHPRDVPDKGIIGSGGRGVGRVYRPGDHLYHGAGTLLADVDPPVVDEVGIDFEPHHPTVFIGIQVAEVGRHGLERAIGEPAAQSFGGVRRGVLVRMAIPFGEQHRPVGSEGDPPGISQAGHQRLDRQFRAGLPRADHLIPLHLGGLPGALTVGVARPGSQILSPDAVRGRVVGLGRSVDVGPVGLVRGLGPLPGHGADAAVRVAQRRPDHRTDSEGHWEQRHGAGLIHVLDGHNHVFRIRVGAVADLHRHLIDVVLVTVGRVLVVGGSRKGQDARVGEPEPGCIRPAVRRYGPRQGVVIRIRGGQGCHRRRVLRDDKRGERRDFGCGRLGVGSPHQGQQDGAQCRQQTGEMCWCGTGGQVGEAAGQRESCGP